MSELPVTGPGVGKALCRSGPAWAVYIPSAALSVQALLVHSDAPRAAPWPPGPITWMGVGPGVWAGSTGGRAPL